MHTQLTQHAYIYTFGGSKVKRSNDPSAFGIYVYKCTSVFGERIARGRCHSLCTELCRGHRDKAESYWKKLEACTVEMNGV